MPTPPPAPKPNDPPEASGGGGTRNATPLYDFPAKRIVHHLALATPVRTSSLRGLGALPNVFALECFVDELAEKANPETPTSSLSSGEAFGYTQPEYADRFVLEYGSQFRFITSEKLWLHFNEGQLNYPTGTFAFNRGFTQGPNPVQSSPTAGFGFATFLLGNAASGTINRLNPISTQGRYAAGFLQDDWRATSRLTLNLGLRWEMSSGDMEKYNRLAYFDPFAVNPLGAKAGIPNLPGQLVWIGQGNGNQQATANNFGPRAGFAYQITPKTVLRGGYGIFFLPRNLQGNGDGAVEAFRTTTMLASIDGLTATNKLNNPYPTGILPPLNDRDPLANVGSTISAPTRAVAARSPTIRTSTASSRSRTAPAAEWRASANRSTCCDGRSAATRSTRTSPAS